MLDGHTGIRSALARMGIAMKGTLRLVALGTLLSMGAAAHGQTGDQTANADRVPAVPDADIATLLRDRDFAALEKHFGSIEEGFANGRISEFELVEDYKPFYGFKDDLGHELKAWTDAFPHSYAAHVARGTYYRKQGEFSRGEAYKPVDESAMQRDFAIAEEDLERARWLAEKPYLAALGLLNIARYRNDEDAAYSALQLGNLALPTNILLRARYQDHLKPRWGGSYPKMREFTYLSKVDGVPGKDLGLLSAMVDDDRASIAEDEDDVDEAVMHYTVALAKARDADPRAVAQYLIRSLKACEIKLIDSPDCRLDIRRP
jgi:tetratricopeptide (TPR) repeat protein